MRVKPRLWAMAWLLTESLGLEDLCPVKNLSVIYFPTPALSAVVLP